MKYEFSEQYGAVVITFKQKLMGGPEAEKFAETINKYLDDGKHNMVADLGDVKFVNSSGIGALIRSYTTVKNKGGELKLANLTDKIEGLLSITKLNSIFEVHPNVDSAIKSFG